MPRKSSFGVIRGEKNILVNLTAAVEVVTDWAPGFEFTIESVKAYTAVVGTGTSASKTFRVLKGASTVVATRTLILAETDTLGEEVVLTVTAANATFGDADVLTVDFAAGGTAFTAGAVNLVIVYRQSPQRI